MAAGGRLSSAATTGVASREHPTATAADAAQHSGTQAHPWIGERIGSGEVEDHDAAIAAAVPFPLVALSPGRPRVVERQLEPRALGISALLFGVSFTLPNLVDDEGREHGWPRGGETSYPRI